MSDLTSLITGENAALVGAIVAILSTMKAVLPKVFLKPRVKRFVPLAPMVLGVIAAYLGFGEAGDALSSWQDKLVLGFIVGFSAGQLYKAGKTSFFGWGAPASQEEYPGAMPSDQEEGD